jgi:hypothetical protein
MEEKKKVASFVIGVRGGGVLKRENLVCESCVAIFLQQNEMKTAIHGLPSRIDQCNVSKASYLAGNCVLFSC